MKVLLFIFFISVSALADDCYQYIGSCTYYLCREKEHACGNKGYFLDFGYKYCLGVKENLSKKLSNEGKDWSSKVAVCLQRSVDKIPIEDNCKDARITAIEGHEDCYLDNGFCELSKKDQHKVMWFVKKELKHPQILKQGLSILNKCR